MDYLYKIVRFYSNGGKRTIKTGLTLVQCERYCNSSESSWSTCRKYVNRKRTKRIGPWIDGYYRE